MPMATKIKDGLFIGDAEASQDPEFIELNKIMFVINCAGRQLPNLWEQHGLHYLTFPWTSDPDCALFDEGNVVVEQVKNTLSTFLGMLGTRLRCGSRDVLVIRSSCKRRGFESFTYIVA